MDGICADKLSKARNALSQGDQEPAQRLLKMLERCQDSSDCEGAGACQVTMRRIIEASGVIPDAPSR